MSQLDRSEIRDRIEKEIQKTKYLISEYAELTKPVEPENAIGRVSRMDAIQNKSVTEAALRKTREKLENLEYALTKVDEEDFGLCVKCKQPIPVGRILIMPQSRTCVSCSR